uniref:Uncharacterized protein n=1 Tax=Aegilops tauschii subsp. strangulata TaxID=200361 RepID=A0A453KKE1_AEGTS
MYYHIKIRKNVSWQPSARGISQRPPPPGR